MDVSLVIRQRLEAFGLEAFGQWLHDPERLRKR